MLLPLGGAPITNMAAGCKVLPKKNLTVLLLKRKVINISIAHYAWFACVSKSGKA